MASAANNTINFVITGNDDLQMDGQDDPVQEERQEEMYTHVFEGQSIPSVMRANRRERVTEIMKRDGEDGVIQRSPLIHPR